MKRIGMKMVLSLLVIGVFAAILPLKALALTASNEDISNTALIDYTVDNVDQAQVSSNTVTFKVDNKVDLTVSIQPGPYVVTPGENEKTFIFTITNNGNTTQGYSLDFNSAITGMSSLPDPQIFLDADDSGTISNGENEYSSGDNIADVPANGSIQVLVVVDIPPRDNDATAGADDGDTATYFLTATTTNAGTATATANRDRNGETPAVVLADGDGDGSYDGNEDGMHTASVTYTVQSANLSIDKSFDVIFDGINNSPDAKAIPGATVEYTITIINSGSQDATGVVVTDKIPANTDFIMGSIRGGAPSYSDSTAADLATWTWTYNPIASVDNPDSTVTGIKINAGAIAGSGQATLKFKVMIE